MLMNLEIIRVLIKPPKYKILNCFPSLNVLFSNNQLLQLQ